MFDAGICGIFRQGGSLLLGRIKSNKLTRMWFPEKYKESHELEFWRWRKRIEGTLWNGHYVYFYTEHFGLSEQFYSNKRILDIGCGPCGSLEWANMTTERVGLDPLAKKYLKLGAAKHKMRYVAAYSENIPFPDRYFDVVCSFNSLDHVANLEETIREVVRVLKKGGLFLLLTEVNHEPTECEPIVFSWDIVKVFSSTLDLLEERHYEKKADGIYDSVLAAVPYEHGDSTRRCGILSAKFVRSRP